MTRAIDLTGQAFGRLTVVERVPRPDGRREGVYWRCRCICGRERVAHGKDLRRGDTLLCGTGCVHAAGRRPWPRDPRYLVGEDGSVVGPRGDVLQTWTNHNGYLTTGTADRPWAVHVIVCETFHGPRPDGMEVAHRNGDRLDPRASNLSWKTRTDNHADKHAHDTVQWGERNANHKLTEAQVLAIRAAAAAGRSNYSLARELRVSKQQVGRIVRREAWAHI